MCRGLALWLGGKVSQVEPDCIIWEKSLNLLVAKKIPTRSFDFSFDISACAACQIIYDEVAKSTNGFEGSGMKEIAALSRVGRKLLYLQCRGSNCSSHVPFDTT